MFFYNRATMLIIALPRRAKAPPQYHYWLSENGLSVSLSGHAEVLELSRLASKNPGEVVVVLPWQTVSWHKVKLPQKGASQIQAVLAGLLEDQLLDELSATHLILPQNIQSLIQNDLDVMVGACSKAWLSEALMPIQSSGLTVQRIVCELTPVSADAPTLYFLGPASEPLSAVLCTGSGVQMLPLPDPQWSAFKELGDTQLRVLSEPQWVKSTAQMIGREPLLHTVAQRMVQATQTEWDAATGEWAQSSSLRLARRIQHAYALFVHSPNWSWSRQALIVCVAVNLLGLNALAWIERSALQHREADLSQLIKESFPSIGLVVDPSAQMQREMKKLKHAHGQSAEGDLEFMLSAAATHLAPNFKLQSFDYSPGELKLNAVSADLISPAEKTLMQKKGYRIRAESAQIAGQSVPVLILNYSDNLKSN